MPCSATVPVPHFRNAHRRARPAAPIGMTWAPSTADRICAAGSSELPPYDAGPARRVRPGQQQLAAGLRLAVSHPQRDQEIIAADADVLPGYRGVLAELAKEIGVVAIESSVAAGDQCPRRIQIQSVDHGSENLGGRRVHVECGRRRQRRHERCEARTDTGVEATYKT